MTQNDRQAVRAERDDSERSGRRGTKQAASRPDDDALLSSSERVVGERTEAISAAHPRNGTAIRQRGELAPRNGRADANGVDHAPSRNGHSLDLPRNGHANGVHAPTVLRPRTAREPLPARIAFDEPDDEVEVARSLATVSEVCAEIDWDALTPRGAYARWGRPVLRAVLVALSLPIALPLALGIALANWWVFRDGREILYVQTRIGHRGRPFRIFKFRTMRPLRGRTRSDFDAWREGSEETRVAGIVGTLLRATHLDELPQIVNILRGEMDFLGPRPEMVEVEAWACRHVPAFATRLALRPGITGFAQVTQGHTGMDVEAYGAKLRQNLRYLRDVSLRLDLWILGRTFAKMLPLRRRLAAPDLAPDEILPEPADERG